MKYFRTIIILLIFILINAFTVSVYAGKSSSSPSPSPSSSSSDSKTSAGKDVFSGEKPTEFKIDWSKIDSRKFSICGVKCSIPCYEIKPGELLVPLNDPDVKRMLKSFDTTVSYDKDSKIITFTRAKNKILRMKIDYNVADYIGQKKQIPIPPRIINDKPYISPSSFRKFIWASYNYDKKNKLYYLDSWVLDVYLQTTKRKKVVIVAKGTGKLKYRILKLRHPTRFVVDVMNSVLDGKARSIHHPTLGEIRFSQHELMGKEGSIVRIVVPQSEEVEIVMLKPRAPNYVEVNLRPRKVSAPVQDLPVQKITDLKIYEKKNLVTIIMTTTGPIQIEWNRLLKPDNRFFIDIPGMVYPQRKKTFKLKSKFIPKVKIAQFQPKPNPTVRMVLSLESPNKVTIETDNKNPKQVKIFIGNDTVDPRKTARKGYIVTYYPSGGLVICLDPGHGGSDPGAVNRRYGVYEKTIALDISRRLKKLLKKEGWTVVMTRNSDRDVTYPGSPDYEELASRSRIANDLKAHVFVSVHINASRKNWVKGVSTYWCKWNDKTLARYIQSSLVPATGRKNLGIRRQPFFVIRHSKMPAALVEVCFLSNSEEAKLLKKGWFRQKAAEGIMNGLRAYAHKKGLRKRK
ncbi:MAG: N-acetylmuramoyl-L-alanine amidase family protein [Candidatus Eremiobacteraeota bacterium]|nr:N-acetylmuramoyl-L-alanine amidase family protein [Candidatus Eremiobacteraeota bacterium]